MEMDGYSMAAANGDCVDWPKSQMEKMMRNKAISESKGKEEEEVVGKFGEGIIAIDMWRTNMSGICMDHKKTKFCRSIMIRRRSATTRMCHQENSMAIHQINQAACDM